MRWQRLFHELESQFGDAERAERDELASELREETWYSTSWRDLLGGHVRLDVSGAGEVAGQMDFVGVDFLAVQRADGAGVLVSQSAVMAVLDWERRAPTESAASSTVGWGSILRMLRDAGEELQVLRRDGVAHRGRVGVVGRDFVGIRSSADREVTIPWSAFATVTTGR